MRKILAALFFVFILMCNVNAKDKAIEPNYIYDEILDANNYKIEKYNYPAGSRELNLFGLGKMRQYNLNAVAAPDFEYLVYSEVYFYPDPQVTASALYLIQLDSGLSDKEKILSVSTKNKNQNPIIETDYANLYPFKFNTFTVVDWSKNSNQVLFKEKLGQNRYEVYLTKLYIYDLSQEKIFDLNLARTKIIEYWSKKGLHLEDYKWDIHPLGFSAENGNTILLHAYGYHKKERKYLGLWSVNSTGDIVRLVSEKELKLPKISSNGKCIKFIPDMGDIFKKQRRIDDKTRQIHIEPK